MKTKTAENIYEVVGIYGLDPVMQETVSEDHWKVFWVQGESAGRGKGRFIPTQKYAQACEILGKNVPTGFEEIEKELEATSATPMPAMPAMQTARSDGPVLVVSNNEKTMPSQTDRTVNIPEKDKTFVPFGCFSDLNTIMKSDLFLPVFISGDSGNGKTFSVEQACARNKRPLVIFNVTNETTEEDLIGHYSLEEGNMIWTDGPVLQAYREGAVLCLDEIDQGTSRLMCLQTILQRKPYYVKKTGETVMPKDGFTIIATGNTKGRGDDSDRFIGAQIMNEAFLERFPVMLEQDYPPASTEARILKSFMDDENLIAGMTQWADQIRKSYKAGAYDDVITTRRMVQIAQLLQVFPKSPKKAVQLGLARFNTETQGLFMELWKNVVGVVSASDLENDTDVELSEILEEFDN